MAKIIEDLNEDEHIIGLYDKDKMDEWMKKIDHEEAIKEGHAKGLEEGRAEGLEQGLEQGLKQGSNKKALKIAKNMLNENMSLSDIARLTGLTEEEIKKL